MKNKVFLGKMDVTDYIGPILKGDIREIEEITNKVRSRALSHEKEILKKLEDNYLNFKYPQVNLSFLRMHNKIKVKVPREKNFKLEYELSEITVPKFGIYPFFGKSQFEMSFHPGEFSFEGYCHDSPVYKFSSLNIGLTVDLNGKTKGLENSIYKNFEYPFRNENMKLIDIKKNDYCANHLYIMLKGNHEDIIKYGSSVERGFSIQSTFNGLISEITREKVKRAERDFAREHIYIVSEIESQEWNKKSVTGNPLIIGMASNAKAYLINNFNIAPLENIVKDWTMDRLN
jgi:hypothetical protein